MEQEKKASNDDQLRSWPEIASYLGTTVRTVQRWERDIGLPVKRIVHNRKATVYASKEEIERWRASRSGEPVAEPAAAPAAQHRPAPEPQPSAPTPTRARVPWAWVAVAGLLVAAAGVFALRDSRPSYAPRTSTLSSLAGTEINPALSPDGKQIAFAWRGPGKADFDLQLMNVDGSGRETISETPRSEVSPAWSPDGGRIAFMRSQFSPEREVEVREIIIYDVKTGEETVVSGRAVSAPSALDWLPEPWLVWGMDGKSLISSGGGVNREPGLFHLGLEPRQLTRLTSASERAVGDLAPALSPDGSMVAFIRRETPIRGDLWIVPAAGGTPKRLTFWERYTASPAFTPDGEKILVTSGDFGGERRLWSVDPAGEQEPELLLLAGEDSFGLTVAEGEDGPRLVFARGTPQTDIWRLGPEENRRLISSSRMDSNAAYSPDGAQIVFESNRSGRAELWLADADGGAQRQLTNDIPPLAGSASWAPDGKRVVVAAVTDQGPQLMLVSIDDGAVTPMTSGDQMYFTPRWARDGKGVYADVGKGEFWALAVVDPKEGSVAENLFGVRRVGEEAGDGRLFVTGDDGWLYVAQGEDPAHEQIAKISQHDAFSAAPTGVVFLGPGMYDHPSSLKRWSGELEELARVERPWMGLSVSADGNSVLYSKVEAAELDLQLANEVW